MERSTDFSSPFNHSNRISCENPLERSSCRGRQYLMCPHCSYNLCFEHGEQHQEQVQTETFSLFNQTKKLETTLNEHQPVQMIVGELFNSLNEWKEKMFHFINEYSEHVRRHLEQAQDRLNEQWKQTKGQYFQMLEDVLLKPLDQLLKVPKQIHPDEVEEMFIRFDDVQNQIDHLLSHRDILRINFDSCSLTGDINISRGHFPSPVRYSSSNSFNLNHLKVLYRLNILSSDTSPLGVSKDMFVTWVKPSTLIVCHAEHGMIKRVDVEPAFLSINDIVWCDYFNQFLLAGAALHTFDLKNNEVKQISIEENRQIWSITSRNTNVFLCYMMGESSLIEHRLLPSFRSIRSYTRLEILPTDSSSTIEIGRCIRTNGQHIAMTIRNLTTLEWRVDIFNFHMQRIFRGENIGCAAYFDYWCCVLTPYRSSSWLVMNNTSKQETVILIDQQAQIKQQMEIEGYNIAVFQREQRMVIKDQQGLAIFQI